MNGNISSHSPIQAFLVGRRPAWTVIRVLVLVVVCFVLFKFVFIPIRVVGISMYPNYIHGRFNLINKLAYRKTIPQRGDVVAVRMAGEQVVLLKRIVALPGERVRIKRGTIYINDQPLEEDYVKGRNKNWEIERESVLEADQYLVVGDNRAMEIHNHYFGLIYRRQIIGRIVF